MDFGRTQRVQTLDLDAKSGRFPDIFLSTEGSEFAFKSRVHLRCIQKHPADGTLEGNHV